MRTQLPGLSLTALLGLSATAAAQHTDSTAGHVAVQMQRGAGITALLTGELGTRSPVGTVTVDGTVVRVAWSGDQPGSTRPWYVHKGSCGRDQGMVGTASAYRPIAVDARGAGTGTATLGAPLTAAGSYFVAVHAAAADTAAGIIACGPLRGGGLSDGRAANPRTAAGMGSMPGMGNMAGMDHNMAGMDHSMMNMSGMQPGGSGTAMGRSQTARAPQGAGADSGSSLLMAVHMRMMADPVIRERAMTDPTLQRMMAQMQMLAGPRAMSMPMRGSTMPGMAMPRKTSGSPAGPKRPTAKRAPAKKPAAAPAAKTDSMPGMNHGNMKGMDHSKMPGMGNP